MIDYIALANEILNSADYNKVILSEDLGISRPTLNTRLEKDNWKTGEKRLLRDIHERVSKT